MIKAENDEGWFGLRATNDENNYTFNNVGLSVTYSVDSEFKTENGVENSTIYYLINKNSKMALCAAEFSVNSNVVQKNFSISEEQQWRLIYAESCEGIDYYKIKTEPLNYFLKANISVAYNEAVRLVLTEPTDATLWQVNKNWDGSYKIIPKSSNNTNALSVYEASMEDNAIVTLGNNTVDFNKEDDWTIIPVDRENATLYGGDATKGSTIDAEVEIGLLDMYFDECSYTTYSNFVNESDEINANDYMMRLFDSQIWYSFDHGGPSRMYFHDIKNGGVTVTAIGPCTTYEPYDDEEESSELMVNVSDIKEYNGNLNKLQLAIMKSCFTGADSGNDSLVGLMYKLGTHCIVSYTKQVDLNDANEWYEYFDLALNRSDVEFALRFADRMCDLRNGSISSRHILGDTSIFYNYEANSVTDEILSINTEESMILDSLSNPIVGKVTNISNKKELLTLVDSNLTDDNVDNYYLYYGSYDGLYGYYSDNILYFYALNHRTDKYGNSFVNKASAMECVVDFIYDVGYGGADYTYTCSNNYSNEFIVDLVPDDDSSAVEGLLSIRVIIENNENNIPVVTFFKAKRDLNTSAEVN